MSHFVGTVILPSDTDLDAFLAPFDENLEVDRYVKYTKSQAIEKERQSIIDYSNGWIMAEYRKDPEAYIREHANNPGHVKHVVEFDSQPVLSDEELFAEAVKYEDDVDSEGNIYSNYNPKTVFDWWAIGGRWSGKYFEADRATVAEWIEKIIKSDGDVLPPRVHITSGQELVRKGEEGWFGYTNDTVEDAEWVKQILAELKKEDPKATVVFMDYHI